jgi:hypothetical protein
MIRPARGRRNQTSSWSPNPSATTTAWTCTPVRGRGNRWVLWSFQETARDPRRGITPRPRASGLKRDIYQKVRDSRIPIFTWVSGHFNALCGIYHMRHNLVRTKSERLALFLERLSAAPTANSAEEALIMLGATLNAVEDEFTTIRSVAFGQRRSHVSAAARQCTRRARAAERHALP